MEKNISKIKSMLEGLKGKLKGENKQSDSITYKEYMKQLQTFLNTKRNYFRTGDNLWYPSDKKITDEDRKMIDLVWQLYELVNTYALENEIKPNKREQQRDGVFYKDLMKDYTFKYRGMVIRISDILMSYGNFDEHSHYCCEKLKKDAKYNIDLNKVLRKSKRKTLTPTRK